MCSVYSNKANHTFGKDRQYVSIMAILKESRLIFFVNYSCYVCYDLELMTARKVLSDCLFSAFFLNGFNARILLLFVMET